MTVPAFHFDAADTPGRLMDELERFIEFWLGPRRPEYGEPESALAGFPLSEPLRRLYAFAGQWPSNDGGGRAFCVQDRLFPFDELDFSDDGRVVFLVENQGCWVCATEPTGNDPPVWISREVDADGRRVWELVTDSLSRFLATFCLLELWFGAKLWATNEELIAGLDVSAAALAVPLWLDGRYVYAPDDFSFHLLEGAVLASRSFTGTWQFAANEANGIRFLMGRHGTVSKVELSKPSGPVLTVTANGGGKVGSRRRAGHSQQQAVRSARLPAKTFDFEVIRERLVTAACANERPRPDVRVQFYFVDRPNAVTLNPTSDAAWIAELFEKALRAALG